MVYRPPDERRPLSQRERQILVLAAQGCSRAEIGARIYVTDSTVKRHLDRIATALGDPGGGVRGSIAAALARGDLDFDPVERKIVVGPPNG